MYRFLFFFSSFLILSLAVQAQSRSLSGSLKDQKTNSPLIGATVELKSLSDSNQAHRAVTDSAGSFLFTELSRDSFNLTISYIGYNTINRIINLDSTDISLDIAAVNRASGEMETVVIRTAISPVAQKGDTLQINASQFKVNPDASGEDLVRKVPGITIENGQVKAQGENVQKVTIDGRELFGDDATAALRNLPAEIIDKIQIFDRLSDQAQFSGFDDGNTNKAINIVTKANMRNGQFGRIYAGYGTDQRYLAGGNATFLKNNRRLSLVGNFNNVNQQNFSQQDLLGVTSNTQRGGGGNRGGGGGRPGGGGGGRPGGGGPGGGNWGNNNNNFLVGQQNGINQTNAFGVNYTDVWGTKLTVTGSYFYNNTDNRTNEVANTEYFNSRITKLLDTTTSRSRNNNHRVNMRIEYRIDSNNQLIITPNLSFQDNRTERRIGTSTLFNATNSVHETYNQNLTNSSRTGKNLGNSILWRHSFPKRGRTFSINLNTSYNDRTGETYVSTFNRAYNTVGFEDTASNRLTDQSNNSMQLSTNISYTEPIGQNSQLQLNYNPSISKSESDQQAFGLNTVDNKYSEFLSNLSNVFKSRTTAQNGGLSYRWGNRDRQISFGANYQYTNLKSEQVYPFVTTVDKSFNNILPNAMVRYKISTRSSMRLFYRSSVNQPSVNQLQGVLDPNNAPVYSLGNPDLDQQFMNTMSTQYTYTNTTKGLLVVGNIFYQTANKYIATATYTPVEDSVVQGETLKPGSRLSKPINLNGYRSLRSFFTFAIPVKFIKSNFNLNGGITFTDIPGFNNYLLNETKNTTITAGAVIGSNVSEYVDFTISYSANFSKARNQIMALDQNYFQHNASVNLNLLSKTGWFFQNDLNNQYYKGLSEGFNQSYFLWNMSAGKKIFKDRKGEIKLGVFDLLKQNRSINRNITSEFIEDVRNEVLQQYFMLTFTYNLRNFGTAAARAMNREQWRER
jgi:uncharacterized membrane protein YgcG